MRNSKDKEPQPLPMLNFSLGNISKSDNKEERLGLFMEGMIAAFLKNADAAFSKKALEGLSGPDSFSHDPYSHLMTFVVAVNQLNEHMNLRPKDADYLLEPKSDEVYAPFETIVADVDSVRRTANLLMLSLKDAGVIQTIPKKFEIDEENPKMTPKEVIALAEKIAITGDAMDKIAQGDKLEAIPSQLDAAVRNLSGRSAA